MLDRLFDDPFGEIVPGKYGNELLCLSVDFFCFCQAEVVLLTGTPFLIVVSKSMKGHPADTIHVPVGIEGIHPFLAAVLTDRAVKVSVGTRIGQIDETDQVYSSWQFYVSCKNQTGGSWS